MNHLTMLIDKSAFQGLASREATWLFHHFRVNLPPVFFAEILADLTKRKPKTASAEGDVKALAKKIVTYAVHPNEGAGELMVAELRGYRFPMDGRIADARTETVQLDDGSKALYIDSTPTQRMLDHWASGDFSESERDFAREWRQGINAFKLEEMFRKVKAYRRADIKSSHDLIRLVDTITQGREYELINQLFELAELDNRIRDKAIAAWKRGGCPPLSLFLPYSNFTLRIELYFLLGLAHQIVTTRDSNRIDIEYLKYLPFTQVFCSSDALHIETAQHFLLPHNKFLNGEELKQGLAQIAARWESVGEDTRKLGTATFANFPPPELNNAVTQIYDQYIEDWRVGANQPKPEISDEENERIMNEVRSRMDAIQRHRRKPKPEV